MGTHERTRVASMMLAAIGWYQRAFAWRPSPCRFYPSCSSYAREAIEVHGARRGGWLALRRLGRCHPFGASGIDLVPEAAPGNLSSPDLSSSPDSSSPDSSSPDSSSPDSSSKETQS